MKVFHQTGHNYKWNLQSLLNDSAGEGLILSPVNIDKEKLGEIPSVILENSFFDPQFYMPSQLKAKLASYEYFPSNLVDDFTTTDFASISIQSAKLCIDLQIDNNLKYLVIPTRHYDVLPTDYFEQLNEHLILPFFDYIEKSKSEKQVLVTVIVKQEQLLNEESKNLLINWITGIQKISGVYLIFENKFLTKQIKDAPYLFQALTFIQSLKENDLEVHIGYTNIEGILFSIANPDSVSMGVYENLKSFNIKRFLVTEKTRQGAPNPRLYSGVLYQFIDYAYIEPIKSEYKEWNYLFEDSNYKPLVFVPEFNWHFTKPELYKHFFEVFSKQVINLPESTYDRIELLKNSFKEAIVLFNDIEAAGVYIDDNSNGSHLYIWLTVISMYEKHLKG